MLYLHVLKYTRNKTKAVFYISLAVFYFPLPPKDTSL